MAFYFFPCLFKEWRLHFWTDIPTFSKIFFFLTEVSHIKSWRRCQTTEDPTRNQRAAMAKPNGFYETKLEGGAGLPGQDRVTTKGSQGY